MNLSVTPDGVPPPLPRGGLGIAENFSSSPEAPLNRGNNDDRRQWRKQGVAVGAAASKTQTKCCGCWVPQPGLVERSETERLSLDLFYHFLSQNSKNFGKAIDFMKLKCYAMSMLNYFTILKFTILKHQRQGGLISPAVPEQEKENPP